MVTPATDLRLQLFLGCDMACLRVRIRALKTFADPNEIDERSYMELQLLQKNLTLIMTLLHVVWRPSVSPPSITAFGAAVIAFSLVIPALWVSEPTSTYGSHCSRYAGTLRVPSSPIRLVWDT